MTTTPPASFRDIVATQIRISSPEEKTVPQAPPQPGQPPQAPTKYFNINLSYNYGSVDAPSVKDFTFEGPELYSPSGISSRVDQGRVSYSVGVMLEPTNTEAVDFSKFYDAAYAHVAQGIAQYKGMMKMYEYNPSSPSATGFKNPIYLPYDRATGTLIPGRASSTYFKLFRRGGIIKEQTLFTDLNGKEIAWETLMGVEMKFIPIVHWEKVYQGSGKFSLQIKVLSAIVTWLRKRNSESTQTETMKRYRENHPEAQDQISQAIGKLTIERRDATPAQSPTETRAPANGGETHNQPTFSGVGQQANGGTIPSYQAPTPYQAPLAYQAPVAYQPPSPGYQAQGVRTVPNLSNYVASSPTHYQ